MESKIVVAADFGNGKIAVAAALKDEQNQIEMIDFKSKSSENLISDGKIVDENALASEVITMIQQIETDNNLQIDKVHFAAAPHTLRSEIRKVSIETSDSADINEALIDQAEEVEISDSRCVFDVVPLEITTIGSSKAEGNFLIISTQNAVQQQFMDLKNSALSAYRPKCFVAPLVEAEQFLSSEQKKNGTLLVDMGLGCTSFAVYKGGLLRLCAVMPLGSKHVTNDIIKTFGVGRGNAEALKTDEKFGLATSSNIKIGEISIKAEELKKVISSRLDEIFNFIFDEIKNQKLETIREIVLVGGGAKMNFLPEHLRKNYGADIKIVDFQTFTNNQNFNKLENALLFALLKDCDEICGRVKKVEEELIEPPKETEKERKERERREEKERIKREKEAEKARKKLEEKKKSNFLQRTFDFLEEKIGNVKEEGIFTTETRLDDEEN